jgi:hypothetical protein
VNAAEAEARAMKAIACVDMTGLSATMKLSSMALLDMLRLYDMAASELLA